MQIPGAYIRECLMAAVMIANMRLLPGMRPRVNCQGASLDKALITVLHGAMIGPLVGVYSIMSAEVGLAIKGLTGDGLGLDAAAC